MSFPAFTAEAALHSSAATYTLRALRAIDPSRIVMATCSGVECEGTYEKCCCPSKCVVTGLGCHCDQAMERVSYSPRVYLSR
jgi:hypothetical protein